VTGKGQNRRELARGIPAAHRPFSGHRRRSPRTGRQITQIYEGTNQIQRMVMARKLLNA